MVQNCGTTFMIYLPLFLPTMCMQLRETGARIINLKHAIFGRNDK